LTEEQIKQFEAGGAVPKQRHGDAWSTPLATLKRQEDGVIMIKGGMKVGRSWKIMW
jgi:hypothetical protein